jgi:membrane carboxypeptidase/penicillin-binding protein
LPSLALGALDTNLLRLTAAYGAIANGGVFIAPRMYVAAFDGDNERLSAPKIVEQRVADEDATYVLTNILQGVVERGTAQSIRRAGFARAAAGKTGTSDSARDAWFVGFTPNLVAGVWVGFDDNAQTGLTGGGAAAPVWADFMKCSSTYLAEATFIAPPGVEFIKIDGQSGLIATDDCPPESLTEEVFVRGTGPNRSCPHGGSQADVPQERLPEPKPERGSFWSQLFE